MLAQLGETRETSPVLARGIDALLADQEKDGSWFGRWGMNYIYGTWSSLCALAIAGQDPQSEPMRRAVEWLERIQNPDGGWGESGGSYKLDYKGYRTRAQHRFADGLGAAWADGGGRSRSSRPSRAESLILPRRRPRTASGASPSTPQRVFRASSTCAITVTRSFFRFGRWPAIATSNAAIAEPPLSACEAPS